MAGGGGGSNTTNALLSPDPETLPIGGPSRQATGKFLRTKELQGQPTVAPYAPSTASPNSPLSQRYGPLKVLPWVVEGAGGLGAGKTSGAGTRGVSLDVVIGGRTGYSNTNGGESSDNRSKVHADCYPAENPSL